jgi:hypothetical protein
MRRLPILLLLLFAGWVLASEYADIRRYMKMRAM